MGSELADHSLARKLHLSYVHLGLATVQCGSQGLLLDSIIYSFLSQLYHMAGDM
jgi:hypothetical protein